MSLTVHLHQSHHQLADFESRFREVSELLDSGAPGLHVFPELHLTGYPLQDLCLHRSFIQRYNAALEAFSTQVATQFINSDQLILCGGLQYDLSASGTPRSIRNVIYKIQAGKTPEAVYTKMLLPNYDIFDERKYFSPGESAAFIDFNGQKIGLMICEDMWPSLFYKLNPVTELKNALKPSNIQLSAVINLSASPFTISKHEERLERAQSISHQFQAPFVYVNSVGGEDEILFDGGSFVVNGDKLIAKASVFASETVKCDIKPALKSEYLAQEKPLTTWEQLFQPALEQETKPYRLKTLDEEHCKQLVSALTFGLQEYATKTGFKSFTVALSGGMDSALVLALAKLSLQKGQTLEAVYMPSIYSSELSKNLAAEMCEKLSIPLAEISIEELHKQSLELFQSAYGKPLEGLANENIQSRLRGALLYTRSNQSGSLVINTSNKSEIAVGYSTLYGDSVGALSLLGDVYKSEVYQLAEYINRNHGSMIPQQIIDRPPSAELREDQKDSDSLPEYEVLDAILEAFLSYSFGIEDLAQSGFDKEQLKKVWTLYKRSEYKRKQFCPILKVKSKSFGFGYRMPLTAFTPS